MSKKTHKMGLIKEEAKSKKPTVRETSSAKHVASGKKPQTAGSKTTGSKPVASKSAVRSYNRPATGKMPVNLLTVRIVALLTAAIALGAGIYWIIQVQGNPTTGVIIGLLVLGLIAGLGIFAAIRAEEVVKSARTAMKR